MGEMLDEAVAAAGSWPDLVLTGRVHHYQRFTRSVAGRETPFIVAGGGGYWHLQAVGRDEDGAPLQTPWPVPGLDVTLEKYCDDRHGFLRLEVSAGAIQGCYRTVPRPHESGRAGPADVRDRHVRAGFGGAPDGAGLTRRAWAGVEWGGRRAVRMWGFPRRRLRALGQGRPSLRSRPAAPRGGLQPSAGGRRHPSRPVHRPRAGCATHPGAVWHPQRAHGSGADAWEAGDRPCGPVPPCLSPVSG